jgi:hypothetical protein
MHSNVQSDFMSAQVCSSIMASRFPGCFLVDNVQSDFMSAQVCSSIMASRFPGCFLVDRRSPVNPGVATCATMQLCASKGSLETMHNTDLLTFRTLAAGFFLACTGDSDNSEEGESGRPFFGAIAVKSGSGRLRSPVSGFLKAI